MINEQLSAKQIAEKIARKSRGGPSTGDTLYPVERWAGQQAARLNPAQQEYAFRRCGYSAGTGVEVILGVEEQN